MIPLIVKRTTTPSTTPPTAMPLRSFRSHSWRRAMKITMRIASPQRRLARLGTIGHRLELIGASQRRCHALGLGEVILPADHQQISLVDAVEDLGAQQIAHADLDRRSVGAAITHHPYRLVRDRLGAGEHRPLVFA